MRQCLKTKYISIFFGLATDTFLLALIKTKKYYIDITQHFIALFGIA